MLTLEIYFWPKNKINLKSGFKQDPDKSGSTVGKTRAQPGTVRIIEHISTKFCFQTAIVHTLYRTKGSIRQVEYRKFSQKC